MQALYTFLLGRYFLAKELIDILDFLVDIIALRLLIFVHLLNSFLYTTILMIVESNVSKDVVHFQMSFVIY